MEEEDELEDEGLKDEELEDEELEDVELEDDIEEVQQRHKDRAVKQGGRRLEERRKKIMSEGKKENAPPMGRKRDGI